MSSQPDFRCLDLECKTKLICCTFTMLGVIIFSTHDLSFLILNILLDAIVLSIYLSFLILYLLLINITHNISRRDGFWIWFRDVFKSWSYRRLKHTGRSYTIDLIAIMNKYQ